MQGVDIFSTDYKPKAAVYGARDRCGEAADRIRSVRTEDYLYIKNFYPNRPLLMPSSYKDSKLILQRLRELHESNELDKLSKAILFAPTRPSEELYRYKEDRWQVNNLANDKSHKGILDRHRVLLSEWIIETKDQGSESREIYITETEDQIQSTRSAATKAIYQKNMKTYLRWMDEGK